MNFDFYIMKKLGDVGHEILMFSCLCPVGCLSLAETAKWAETGKLQFWSWHSEILNLKSSNTNTTLGHTPL